MVEETIKKKKSAATQANRSTTTKVAPIRSNSAATQANRSTTTKVAPIRSNIKYYIPYRISEVRLKSIKAV